MLSHFSLAIDIDIFIDSHHFLDVIAIAADMSAAPY